VNPFDGNFNLPAGREYCGAILAAGRGSRMQPFSERYPKPLLPVCNKPLIGHQIDIMRSMGIRNIVVLIGHKGYEIARYLGDGTKYGVSITYVEQTQMIGIAHAVGCLEPYLQHPFLLFLGDIFFVPDRIDRMVEIFEAQEGGAVLATREEPNVDAIRRNFSISLGPDGRVTRVMEKPRHAPNRLKGVGIYLFDLTIFDAIRRTPRTALRDEYELTESIQVMIDDEYPVRTANVIANDINLTGPSDLLRCNLMVAETLPPKSLIGDGSWLHPEAKVSRSIIGSNVTVQHPITITRSLIFDGTRLQNSASLDRHIVTPDGVVDCRPLCDWDQIGVESMKLAAAAASGSTRTAFLPSSNS
jgi:dTDP-glucose pyrophosphorylase